LGTVGRQEGYSGKECQREQIAFHEKEMKKKKEAVLKGRKRNE
jgi:hypothetical protein